MLTRMEKIKFIRDGFEQLIEEHRFEAAREVMGEVDRFNFSGVSDSEINSIYWDMVRATCKTESK